MMNLQASCSAAYLALSTMNTKLPFTFFRPFFGIDVSDVLIATMKAFWIVRGYPLFYFSPTERRKDKQTFAYQPRDGIFQNL